MGHYASEMDPDFGKPPPLNPDFCKLRCTDIVDRMNKYIELSADTKACQLAAALSELAIIVRANI